MDQGIDTHLDDHGNPRTILRTFTVDSHSHGLRLDQFLKKKIPRLSRNKLQKIIKLKLRDENERALKPNYRVKEGNQLFMESQGKPEPPCPRTFTVLHQDQYCMAINKPAGLPMHATAKYYFNTLSFLLREVYGDRPPQLCHRIDKETSGVLLLSRSPEYTNEFQQLFEGQKIRKTYLAIVHGQFPTTLTSCDASMRLAKPHESPLGVRMVVCPHSRPATTQFSVLRTTKQYSLVRCRPRTGRQHQIRLHLAHLGFPIVGDKLYAHGDEVFQICCDQGVSPAMLSKLILPRHALHAASQEFVHPFTKRKVTFHSPFPPELRQLLDGDQ